MKKIRVIHKAPKKRGKQETREFKSLTEAVAYVERNTQKRQHGKEPRIGK